MASEKKDIWDAEVYTKKVAPFVPQLTSRIVSWLDPQPTDHVLDIGCGDGLLTSSLASHCASITGVDGSPKQIAHLKATYPGIPAHVLDCSTSLSPTSSTSSPSSSSPSTPHPLANHTGTFTKLFSNAALHWILRTPRSRRPFFTACATLLAPGGTLVSESGALGNVAEVHAALVNALVQRGGVAVEEARAASPWWFPALEEARAEVEGAGLEWVKGEVELRQTVLTQGKDGGVRGWVRLFGAPFREALVGGDGRSEEGEEEEVERIWSECVEQVVQAVESVGRRADGGVQVNYVRLRFMARKPE